jgi:glycosyltransferase involved in cell wall biosynthesis
MKIAFIVPYVPNKIRTRPYNLIRYLSRAGHEVVLFTVGSSSKEYEDSVALQAHCRAVHYQKLPVWRSGLNALTAVPTRVPLQSVYSWDGQLALQLTGALKNGDSPFDVVHVEHLRGSKYGRFVRKNFPAIPIVWDSVDCISYLFEQAGKNNSTFFGKTITRFELGRTRLAEAELIRFFDHVLTTSQADRNALLKLPHAEGEPSPISVLPGGVDLDYFHPNSEINVEPGTLVFSGKMSYHANIAMAVHLVEQILPRVWQKFPNVKLYIVGKDPSRKILEYAQNPLIHVTGTVDDIRPYLWKASVAVVPLIYGAGIQNKILEAMACGTPVVTNSRALSALNVYAGQDVLVGDDPETFAAQIIRLVDDTKLREKVGVAGLKYVRQNHDWKQIAGHLVEIYKQAGKVRKIARAQP